MSSKFFNVNNPKQIVTIVEDKDKFYELSDGNMIKKDTFMQKYQPVLDEIKESVSPTIQEGNSTNTLDPENFFNVKSVPDDVITGVQEADPTKGVGDGNRTEVVHKGPGQEVRQSPTVNESLVKQVPDSPIPDIPNNTNTDVSQYKVYDNDEDAFADFENKNRGAKPPKPNIDQKKMEIELLFDDEKMALGEEEAISRRNKRLLKLPTAAQQQTEVSPGEHMTGEINTEQRPSVPEQLSPIELMFSTFKRKHPITINVSFEDKIGEPDFVKLMVENMDGDIVGYYKNLIMSNIMKDLSKIEEAVKKEIQLEIFGKEELTEDEQIIKNSKEQSKDFADLVEKTLESKDIVLIPGGTTKTGKQKYKYVDNEGNVKELLPNTAKTKGYEPYTEE